MQQPNANCDLGAPATVVGAVYGSATFAAHIQPGDVRGYAMAGTLLWCFCRGSQLAEPFTMLAHEGGHMFIYEITGSIPGPVNFRSIVGPTAAHPYADRFPDPRLVNTEGSA